MASKISDPKVYEYIVFQHDPHKDLMLKALDLVRDFIVEKKLVITGGMAVDFALKLKGGKLYDDNTLPDYDFFSPEHSNDAYELAKLLCLRLPELFPDEDFYIDAIPATHVTTMRVRINYTSIADITYLPHEVFNNLPTLEYPIEGSNKMLKFRHPHMQMIDQHRALSLPYEHAPQEVILHRWRKDMKRFDMLYKHYSIEGKELDVNKFKEIHINPELLEGTCVGGFAALYLLVKHEQKTPDIRLSENEPLVIYSEHFEVTVGKLIDHFKSYVIKYYNQYLDVLPSKFVLIVDLPTKTETPQSPPKIKPQLLLSTPMDGGELMNGGDGKKLEIHIYDTSNQLISAVLHKNFHIADAQNLLAYFLSMHFLNGKSVSESSHYKDAYVTIGELVKNKTYPPTHEVYGKSNIAIERILARAETLSWNKEIPKIKTMLKPGRFKPDENKKCEIPPNLDEFIYEESPLFHINGKETTQKSKTLTDFINPVIYESSDSETEH
jgi:hypothetical protein